MNNIIKRKWNQNSMVIIEDLQGMAFQAESGGHTFQISGIDGEGNAVALSGTPAGVMLRSDGQDVTLTCSVSGGVVFATLPANAYVVPGRFGLTIFLTSAGQKTAIYAAVGTVGKTSSGTVAPPAGSDVVDLVNAIATAVATIPASYTDLMASVAPTYSSSGLYAVGSYAWYNGKLYRCTTAITSGETWTSGHWTLANLGSDLVDLKSALKNDTWRLSDAVDKICDIKLLKFSENGYYIKTSGSTVDVTDLIHVTYNIRCAVADCAEGDRVVVTGSGGTDSRLWAFIDADGNTLDYSAPQASEANVVHFAPSGAAKVIINDTTNSNSYIGVLLHNTVDDIHNSVVDIISKVNMLDKNRMRKGGYYASDGSITYQSTGVYSDEYIPVEQGVYYFKYDFSTGKTLSICTYNSSKTFQGRFNYNASSGGFYVGNGIKHIRFSIVSGDTIANSLVISKEPYVDNQIMTDLRDGIIKRNNMSPDYQLTERFFGEAPLVADSITVQNGYMDGSCNFVSNDQYKTYSWRIEEDCQCYFVPLTGLYYSLCVYNSSTMDVNTKAMDRLRDGTLPLVNSKLSLYHGQYIAVTLNSGNTSSCFYINDEKFQYLLSKNIHLQETHYNEIGQKIQSGSPKVFVRSHGVYGTSGCGVYFYIKTGVGYVRYDLQYQYMDTRNCDVWRVDSLHAVDDMFADLFCVTVNGEWECALKLDGRSDYMGGMMHGDEIVSDIVFIADGTPYTAQAFMSLSSGGVRFEEIKIVEGSTLYDPNDSTTAVAYHGKEYTFTVDGLDLRQSVEWILSETLADCYLAMFPIAKTYSNKFYADTDCVAKAIASCYGDHSNTKKVTYYSTDYNVLCSLDVLEYPTGLTGSDVFNLRDNGSTYNKGYFNVCTSGNVESGTIWKAHTKYFFVVAEQNE